MLTYAIIFIVGALAMLALRRVLVVLLRGALMTIGVVLAGRLALMADDRLSRPEWISGGLIGGVVAFVVVGILCANVIYNALVNARRAGAHDRIDKEHDGLLR